MPAFYFTKDEPIAGGQLSWPAFGRAEATLLMGVPHSELSLGPGATRTLTLELPEGTLTLQGAALGVRRTPEGWAWVRWVAGKARLHKVLKPKFYRNVPARVAILDALNEVGEEAGELDADTTLPVWTRYEEPAYRLLDRLTQAIGRVWRVNEKGQVEVTAPEWPPTPEVKASRAVASGVYRLPLLGPVRPGTTLPVWLGGKVAPIKTERVVYYLDPQNLGVEVWDA
jgi:hypothetical protein